MRSSLLHLASGAVLVLLGACSPASTEQQPEKPATTQTAPATAPTTTAAATTTTAAAAPGSPKARSLPKGKAESPRVALGTQGAVSSQEGHATDVGVDILKRGGNAVDAAVAVGFALAVTHPAAGNVGGGGFMVVRLANGEKLALDYREVAPSAATRDMYLDKKGDATKDSVNGAKAAGIPGTVAGLAAAHAKLGKLPWKDVVAPAVRLAREGFALDPVTAKDLIEATKRMRDLKLETAAKMFSKPDGSPFAAGDRLVQTDLAKTLQAIADGGPKAFYEGPIAETMAREVQKAGGIWKAQDLAKYQAKWREPVVFTYRGHEIITMPPPSAGGVVLKQLLTASEILKLDQKPWRGADEVHLSCEAMRRAYADRNLLLGDPDFIKIPMSTLLDPKYIAGRLNDIDPQKATPSTQIKAGVESSKKEGTQTTHYSVVDRDGNAVSNTYTLNLSYGSKFMVPGTGVLLNNEMDDFAVKPGTANAFGLVQGEQNKIEPDKRMLSSMTPTIVTKDGELRAIVGSPGGPTISTTVAQIVRGLVDYNRPLDEVLPAIRAHHQWQPDQIFTEEAMPAELQAELEKRGHVVKKRSRIGHANSIEVDVETRGFRAVADTTRGGGKAGAY
ncbi:MAG TPA: gamma-glutamyltransferase [Polyangiaceae bacterium]|nr:gamma-glutamyltransferase [Polyangiaceae bacterium]